MVTICLLRHGETAFNADGNKYCGRTDIDLTEKGLQQANRMRDLLVGYRFDAVYSSPLFRAKKTAQIASGRPADVMTDDRLIEIDFGDWEGKRAEQFIQDDPDAWASWLADPLLSKAGRIGESGAEVLERLRDFYRQLAVDYEGKNVLVVGHNGVNRFFLSDGLGMPLQNYRQIQQDNSSLTLLTLTKDGKVHLVKLNA